jgi:hypothetical protein
MLGLVELSKKVTSLDHDFGERWEKCALDALVDDSAYALQVAFTMDGADIRTKIVGYSRYGRYGRTSLKDYDALPQRPPGDSLLHLAVRNNRPYAVEKLLSLGADPVQGNSLGESALDIANSKEKMRGIFRGLVINLPTGDKLIYEDSKLRSIQNVIKHDKMEDQVLRESHSSESHPSQCTLTRRCAHQPPTAHCPPPTAHRPPPTAHQVREAESRMRDAADTNKNHLRARDHSEAKLAVVRGDFLESERMREIAEDGRREMQVPACRSCVLIILLFLFYYIQPALQ